MNKLTLQARQYYTFLNLILLTSYFILAGCCGYSTRSLIPNYIRKIHIKLFDNQTVKAGLDEIATQSVIEAFRSGSPLHIVDERSAELVLEGRVSNFSKEPYIYTGAQNISQYKLTVKFTIRCINQVKNEVFWEGDVSDWAIYESDENAAIEEAMQKTAKKLVTTILTNW